MQTKPHFNIIIITVLISVLSIITPISAHAMSMGPWKRADDTYQPLVQAVTNGNEIYYSINDTQYTDDIQQAITAWNNLNVIKLIPVAYNDPRRQINITEDNDPNKNPDVTATTEYNMQSSTNNNTKIPANTEVITDANVVTSKKFKNLSNDQKIYTLEHEIGHALGFAHDNRTVNQHKLIMYWSTPKNQYPLGGLEQRMLAYYYQLPIQGTKLTTKY